MQRLIKVDGKVRTDSTFPCGFMDVISIDKTDEHFRLVLDTKGRFVVHRISKEEAAYKLCRVSSTHRPRSRTKRCEQYACGREQARGADGQLAAWGLPAHSCKGAARPLFQSPPSPALRRGPLAEAWGDTEQLRGRVIIYNIPTMHL